MICLAIYCLLSAESNFFESSSSKSFLFIFFATIQLVWRRNHSIHAIIIKNDHRGGGRNGHCKEMDKPNEWTEKAR
jgi:hypothetical protein